MAKRVSTSALPKSRLPKSRPRLALGAAALLLAAGAGVAHQAIRGHGRWHALAVDAYHRLRDRQREAALAAEAPPERADAPLLVYAGRLGDGWQDWSWATHTLGRGPITLTPEGHKGVYLHHDPLGLTGYGSLLVLAHDADTLDVVLVDAGGKFGPPAPLSRYGYPARIPLADLGVPPRGGACSGVVLQAATDRAQPPATVDRVALLPDPALPPAPTRATVPVALDVRADRHFISPLIYGMAFAPPDYLQDLRLPVNRWGGNDKSRYNWAQGNAVNAASDWNFADKPASGGDIPPGPSSAADRFVRQNAAAGAVSLLTVPTLGWVARDADNGHASQNVPGQGGAPLSGAGPDGAIAGYDPARNRALTSVRSVARAAGSVARAAAGGGAVPQDGWVRHLVAAFGAAAHGGVALYAMDNEPDLWDTTHRDVHPARLGYDDTLAEFLDYATAVKAVDPTAQVTGPVLSGWTGYEFSALDRGDDNFHTHADQDRHGGEWLLPWFLHQVRDHDRRTGRRTLDVLDVHYYPQGQGLYGAQDDPDAQARRLRSVRSLWDPAYTDESWVGQPVRLIPRLRDWVAEDYPGTRLGITEWSFGADRCLDGGLATADALGVFGREGVFLADYWAYPTKGGPAYLAFKLYRNADGRGHGLGDQSVRAASADPARLAAYAAVDTRTGALTVMLVNKMPRATVTAPLTGLPPGARAVKMWRVSADNGGQIVAPPALPVSGAALTLRLPPYSMTLLRTQDTPSPKGGSR